MGNKVSNNIDRAISIATKAHEGQVDKAGLPYILHPLRVMFQFTSEVEMIVAVMHDVVEDSDVTIHELSQNGFSTIIIEAIDCLTKRKNENYNDFILRISTNDLAIKIKIGDIRDNLNLTRLNDIDSKDFMRINKYYKALKFLEKQISRLDSK